MSRLARALQIDVLINQRGSVADEKSTGVLASSFDFPATQMDGIQLSLTGSVLRMRRKNPVPANAFPRWQKIANITSRMSSNCG